MVLCFYHFQDAADRCIAVEFVVLVEGETNIYHDDAEKLMQFTNSVCDLESCVIRSYIMGKFLRLSKIRKSSVLIMLKHANYF